MMIDGRSPTRLRTRGISGRSVRCPTRHGARTRPRIAAEAIRAAWIYTQVFRLDEGPAQSTGTILDALKNIPGVTVDQEGKVSLRGSDKVAILIDGRQSSLTGFGTQRGLDSAARSRHSLSSRSTRAAISPSRDVADCDPAEPESGAVLIRGDAH
jgi:hypothetical protein